MTNNEITGDTALDFIGQMVWAEQQLLPQGNRLRGSFVSADSDTGYTSTFDMTGLEQALAYIIPRCGR